jgi:hypothetical protein
VAAAPAYGKAWIAFAGQKFTRSGFASPALRFHQSRSSKAAQSFQTSQVALNSAFASSKVETRP